MKAEMGSPDLLTHLMCLDGVLRMKRISAWCLAAKANALQLLALGSLCLPEEPPRSA